MGRVSLRDRDFYRARPPMREKPRRRWLSFRLRTLLVAIAATSMLLPWAGCRSKEPPVMPSRLGGDGFPLGPMTLGGHDYVYSAGQESGAAKEAVKAKAEKERDADATPAQP